MKSHFNTTTRGAGYKSTQPPTNRFGVKARQTTKVISPQLKPQR